MYDLDATIRTRRSVRGFHPDRPVSEDTLREALELAQRAPSNCNVQPWRVFIARGEACNDLRQTLLAAIDGGNFGDPEDPIDTFVDDYRDLQIECAVALYESMGIARQDKLGRLRALRRNFEFFDAPHIAIVCMEDHFGLGVAVDVGMWVQTFMLALKARGIDTCAQASMRHYPEQIRTALGIPTNLRILCGVSFGYENEAEPANTTRQTRAPIESNIAFRD